MLQEIQTEGFGPFAIAKHVRHLNDKKMRGKLIDMIGFAWLFCWRQVIFGKRWKVWVPIPGIATHMESNYLAPTFSWVNDPAVRASFY
jgi:hypothetical protein